MNIEKATNITGYRLRRAQVSVFQRIIAALAAVDLRPVEYVTLELIEANPGRKQSDLAEVLGLKRANFVVVINQLEGRSLVERRPDAGDRRANALYLSPPGLVLLAKARVIQERFEQDCIDRLGGEDEKRFLLALLDRLV